MNKTVGANKMKSIAPILIYIMCASFGFAADNTWPLMQSNVCEFALLKSAGIYTNETEKSEYVFGFNCGFHRELVDKILWPNNTSDISTDSAGEAGFHDACEHHAQMTSNSPLSNISLQDYGYTFCQTNGEYSPALPFDWFLPSGSEDKRWRIYKSRITRGAEMLTNSIHIIATGYLSPPNDYPDDYSREFIAVEVILEKEPQQAGAGFPPQGVGSPVP